MSDIGRDYRFGGWLRHLRLEAGKTLRQACESAGINAGNYSKLERSQLSPPDSREKVEAFLSKLDFVCEADYEFLVDIAFSFHSGALFERFK